MPDTTAFLPLTPAMAGPGASWMVVLGTGVLALVVMALLSESPGNDDDDSTPGGGLMQPVA